MFMNFFLAGMLSWVTLSSGILLGQVYQCSAGGHSIRRYGVGEGGTKVQSILQFDLSYASNGRPVVIKETVGHVAVAAYPTEKEVGERVEFDYYASFNGLEIEDTPSQRASTYKSDQFLRFRGFNASYTSRSDGGGMWGYLVVEKDAQFQESGAFAAHYVFQAGDHMGGTIDYSCIRL